MTLVTEKPFKVGRKLPRIVGFWSDDPQHENVVIV